MLIESNTQKFPGIRLATIDIGAVSKRKHHVTALIEVDVTDCRIALKSKRLQHENISLTAWLIGILAQTIQQHETVASFLKGKRSLIFFKQVNVSLIVEKEINGQKVPVPLLIENAHEINAETITSIIREATQKQLLEKEIVLHRKSAFREQVYYHLPGWARRGFWYYMLKRPEQTFKRMGNVSVTALGMIGKAKGWFIPLTVHPICFALGNVAEKPRVVNKQIVIREIMNITVMMDHDVVDGANMARFLSDLTQRIEKGTK